MSNETVRRTVLYGGLLLFAMGIGLIFVSPSVRLLGIVIGIAGLVPALLSIERIWRIMPWGKFQP